MKALILKVIKAGVLVGTLDLLAAFTYYLIKSGDTDINNILRFIASGIFGKQAFTGGINFALIGLLLHFFISLVFTAFLFWLYPKHSLSFFNKVLVGIFYGMFIWAVMNLIVVPFSNVPNQPFIVIDLIINLVILVLCIGLPLSFLASNYYAKTK